MTVSGDTFFMRRLRLLSFITITLAGPLAVGVRAEPRGAMSVVFHRHGPVAQESDHFQIVRKKDGVHWQNFKERTAAPKTIKNPDAVFETNRFKPIGMLADRPFNPTADRAALSPRP
jgi:hypothetical protein